MEEIYPVNAQHYCNGHAAIIFTTIKLCIGMLYFFPYVFKNLVPTCQKTWCLVISKCSLMLFEVIIVASSENNIKPIYRPHGLNAGSTHSSFITVL
jgi:hypothetical protein